MPHRTKGGLQPTRQPYNCNPPFSSEIFNLLYEMKKNAYSDYSINFTRKALTFLAKNCNLNNPDTVKTFIANRNASNHYKRNLCIAYNKYVKHYKLTWNMPLYRQPQKLPNIPTTEKLNMLISKARTNLAIKLKISMETGVRPIELMSLKVKDVNLDTKTIYPSTAKNGSARTLKITAETTEMLKIHIVKHKLNLTDEIFNGSSKNYGKQYRQMRNNLATKLQDPSIRNIRLYDLRHYFATRLYAKTRDILYVMQQMGHKKIENTLKYTQLININEDEEYTCKIANNIKEATQLIENGFEYIAEKDDIMLFRKRK
jgi:integrase